MKNEAKIRSLLDYKKFHLHTSNTGEWSLFRNYDDFNLYMSSENEPIMTHETHTEEDLLKFAKKHREIDFQLSNGMLRIVIASIVLFLCMVSIFTNNATLRYIIWTANVINILWAVIDLIIDNHNHKIIMEELKEQFELRKKIIESKKNTVKE